MLKTVLFKCQKKLLKNYNPDFKWGQKVLRCIDKDLFITNIAFFSEFHWQIEWMIISDVVIISIEFILSRVYLN